MTAGITLDLVGQEFGKAKVISRCGSTPQGMSTWNTQCACGEKFVVPARAFRDFKKTGYEPKCFKCQAPRMQKTILTLQKRREEKAAKTTTKESSFTPSGKNGTQAKPNKPTQSARTMVSVKRTKSIPNSIQNVKSNLGGLKRSMETLVRLFTLAEHLESDDLGFAIIAKTIVDTYDQTNQNVEAIRLALKTNE